MEINRKTCLEIFEWCKTKYGMSKYQKDFPKLHFRSKAAKDKIMGPLKGEFFYEENEIYIYKELHLLEPIPLLDVVNTIIHEYKHFLQNMENYDMYFDKYKYSYHTHPYEKTCNRFAGKEQDECYQYLLKIHQQAA
jgi:hypothetical protein